MNSRQTLLSIAAILLLLASLAACSGDAPPPGAGPPSADAAPPPPSPEEAPQISAPEAPAESSTLSWDAPQGWVEVPPPNAMRNAQYRVPGSGGDAELIVFYFGPGQGGDAMSNARRWVGQFRSPEGQPLPEEDIVLENRPGGDVPVLVVEAKGTFVGGMGTAMGGSDAVEGQMLLGAIAQGPDSNWFFKLIGPEATVEENRAGFDQLISSLR